MKCLLTFAFWLLLAASPAWAQLASSDLPASKEDIQKLFVALHVRERQQLTIDIARKQTKTMAADVLNKELPEATKEELSQFQAMIDGMVDDVEKDYPIDAVLQDLVPIYQRHLTKSDCDQLLAFYSSPVGQKVLREMPTITSETMQVSNSYLQPRMEAAVSRVKAKMERMIAEENQKKKDITPTETKPAAK
ncbi:MAG: DUF2059 domain-containing protein [Terriglobales bacterium]|jgi:hypothetical protein